MASQIASDELPMGAPWVSLMASLIPSDVFSDSFRRCLGLPPMACHQVNWSFATGETVPGLAARAAALGYRTAAAVSGTTANVLQMGALLGFGGEERVMLHWRPLDFGDPTRCRAAHAATLPNGRWA